MALQKPTSNIYLTNRVLTRPTMNNYNNSHHDHHFADTEIVEFPWCLKKSKSSFTSTIKGAFYNCRAFRPTLSNYVKSKEVEAEEEEEEEGEDSSNNNEEEIVVSEIRARAMEARSKRKTSFILMLGDSFRRVILSSTAPTTQGDLCLAPVAAWEATLQNKGEEEVDDDFCSVRSYLSCASTARSGEEFVSVRTNFTRSRSMSGIDDQQLIVLQELWREEDVRRRMIIKEIIHCEGWPFGLCRKALLLPPLPKSPAESWKWRNSGKLIRAP